MCPHETAKWCNLERSIFELYSHIMHLHSRPYLHPKQPVWVFSRVLSNIPSKILREWSVRKSEWPDQRTSPSVVNVGEHQLELQDVLASSEDEAKDVYTFVSLR